MKNEYKPPDWKEREIIHNELDRNIIVEAAAGTGKTTALVGRMINLLEQGKCTIRNMVAITFTKKASCELRSRFRIELEKKCCTTSHSVLQDALDNLETCFIGTIHSFCARLLRERPVEADVNIPFEEMEPEADLLLRQQVWEEYISGLIRDNPDGIIEKLDSLAIQIPDLLKAFLTFTDFPDITLWPGGDTVKTLPSLAPVLDQVKEYAAHMESLFPRLPDSWKNDKLIPFYREFPRALAAFNPESKREMYELFLLFDKDLKLVQKDWIKDNQFTKEECKEEKVRWDHFREHVITPVLELWRVCRYGPVMNLLKNVCSLYDETRRDLGKMNFSDLLIKAAGVLKGNPNVRLYFQNKYRRLLIDEFQDTDPIQAEVMMFLTSKDPEETDFKKCVPLAGSLFVVGDPKQSIYRFRRADIVTYNDVKQIICKSGTGNEQGLLIQLSANFRSTRPIREWVNRTFIKQFPETQTPQSPVYVALRQGREASKEDEQGNVYTITIKPEDCKTSEAAADYEGERIACFIRDLLEKKDTSYNASDFMIITRKRKNLALYADKLAANNVPYAITGGTTLNDIRELKLLYLCLKTILNPDDPVALVGTLRSELFGFSDTSLYEYRKAHGKFSYNDTVPEALNPEMKDFFKTTFNTLKEFRIYFDTMPAVAACERVIADLGLMPLACISSNGHLNAGGLAKCIELIRNLRSDLWSPAELVHYLKDLIDRVIAYDGISVSREDNDVVRIMNLHQAKGLEARVVFLADSSGKPGTSANHQPETHIRRTGKISEGYMMVRKQTGYHSISLAYPENWTELANEEVEFLASEDIRLLYVAATRARETLVIVQKEKNNTGNFWKDFRESLAEAPELPFCAPKKPPELSEKHLTEVDIQKAHGKISGNLALSLEKTYHIEGAKEWALREYPAHLLLENSKELNFFKELTIIDDAAEHSTEWGEVIHKLLEIRMKDNQADIKSVCESLLAKNNLDPGLLASALTLVSRVVNSEIWERARSGSRMFTEIPFQTILDNKYNLTLPTILRGVIDLAFLETEGWVIVDYKTDKIKSKRDIIRLKNKYAQQLSLYADAWVRATREKVMETGLYFISVDEYCRVV